MNKNGFDGLNESLKDLRISKPIHQAVSPSREKGKLKYPHQVDSYYAVNAPAPGTVGVASARINKPYAESQGLNCSHGGVASPNSHGYNGSEIKISSPRPYTNSHAESPAVSPSPRYVEERRHYANISASSPQYNSYGYDENFPPAPYVDELYHQHQQCPPSPVSSSYSELRHTHPTLPSPRNAFHPAHANVASQNTPTYAPLSHTSSTYESIYESLNPVNEMPQMKKYHGPYVSPMAQGLAPVPSDQPVINPDRVGKEAEVDALTSLLVQSMDSSADPEFFGMCARCGERVLGEGSGCTAMEQVFHIRCFCCIVCLLKLQGKAFYALESKPYCEECYLNTLEKCSVCMEPILDRILRATGKPYHPQCFSCVVCHKSLDGIPFTVDASNQIHCIDDFHKKFAPRCSVCNYPIMPEAGKEETVRVVALDRSFHVGCYKCEDCGLVLSSEAEGKGCYPLDNHVLCKSCNARRVQKLTSKVSTDL